MPLILDYSEVLNSHERCVIALSRMHGIFIESQRVIKSNPNGFLRETKYNFEWCTTHDKVEILLNKMLESKHVEVLLNLTASLEFALGNVYWTIKKKTPPHLLRDLLETTEVKSTFGEFQVNVFKTSI